MIGWGRYELIHPNSEAVHGAIYLWFRFGDDPDFRMMLDNLYERTIPLLDAVSTFNIPGSSLQDLAMFWEMIKSDIMERRLPVEPTGFTHEQTRILREQASAPPEPEILLGMMQELVDAVNSWGLRCPWAPYSLLYTLNKEHSQRRSREDYPTWDQLFPFGNMPKTEVPQYIPKWQGTDVLVNAGLTNPGSGGFAGMMTFGSEGEVSFVKGDDKPMMSFYDAGPEGYSVPDGATLEQADALHRAYHERFKKVQEMFKREGMVEPKSRVDLDQTIDWLFIRLRHGVGWKRLANGINSGEFTSRWGERWEGRFTWSNVSKRVKALMKLLQIEPDPETEKYSARFKASEDWK